MSQFRLRFLSPLSRTIFFARQQQHPRPPPPLYHHQRLPRQWFSTDTKGNDQNQDGSQPKTLGRHPRSITAPLAAFVMALILAAYSIKRIRDAKYRFSGAPSSALEAAYERSEERRRRALRGREDEDWVGKALEEKKREEDSHK